MQHLYRHFDRDNNLLYVGVSLSAIQRLGQHSEHSHWFSSIARVEIQNFETREEVLAAERKAITDENPRHNLKRPREERKRANDAKNQFNESRSELVRRLVFFKPMYTLQEAALAISFSTKFVKQQVSLGKLGHILIHTGAKEPRCFISGWQLMDYLENLQCKAI
jgi:predicted GIY-YIG superfamily endonuclease